MAVGIKGEMVDHYVNQWIIGVEDVTPLAHKWRDYSRGDTKEEPPWPNEREYPVPDEIAAHLGMK